MTNNLDARLSDLEFSVAALRAIVNKQTVKIGKLRYALKYKKDKKRAKK